MKQELQDVHERMMALDPGKPASGKSLKTTLLYEFWPILEESDLLRSEVERRALYFVKLAEDESYLRLISEIHALMKELHGKIDTKKLKDGIQFLKPKYDFVQTDEAAHFEHRDISAHELHAYLIQKDQWWYLGDEKIPYEAGDSLIAPYKVILHQYETVLGLITWAWKCQAIEMRTCDQLAARMVQYINELKNRFERPLHRLHIKDFQTIYMKVKEPRTFSTDMSEVKSLQPQIDRVFKDLMIFLDKHEGENSLQKPPLSITSYRVEYDGSGQMRVQLGEKSTITKLVGTEMELCKAVYECEGGTLSWDEAYERIENAEPPTNKEQIRRYRKKLTDAKERINTKVSAIARKEVLVVTQDEEGNFIAALAAVTVR